MAIEIKISDATEREYNANWKAYMSGDMTEQEWRKYCTLLTIRMVNSNGGEV